MRVYLRRGITNLTCLQQTVVIQSLVVTGTRKMTRGLRGVGLARRVEEEWGQRTEHVFK